MNRRQRRGQDWKGRTEKTREGWWKVSEEWRTCERLTEENKLKTLLETYSTAPSLHFSQRGFMDTEVSLDELEQKDLQV